MKYVGLSLITLCFNFVFSSAFAGTQGEVSPTSLNETGYFVGIGGSYNYGQIDPTTTALLNASSGFPPLGLFSGTIASYSNSAQAFAPEAQVGYFNHFQASPWLWGLEFLYQYSNLTIDSRDAATFINVYNPVADVTDLITIGQLRTNVNDTLMLPVFLGYSFANSFIYAGVGPSLFYTSQKVSNVDDSFSAFYLGNIDNFSTSQWVWGGAVQAGMAYYVNPSWFLKLNYSCAFTGTYTVNNPFGFSEGVNRGLNSGTLTFNTQQSLVTQEVALSINKVFSL